MGQGQIIEILKKNPKRKYTTKELAVLVNVGRDVLNNSLRPMRKRNEIGSELIYDNTGKKYVYFLNQEEVK